MKRITKLLTTRSHLPIPEYLAWRWGWFTMFCGFLLGAMFMGILVDIATR